MQCCRGVETLLRSTALALDRSLPLRRRPHLGRCLALRRRPALRAGRFLDPLGKLLASRFAVPFLERRRRDLPAHKQFRELAALRLALEGHWNRSVGPWVRGSPAFVLGLAVDADPLAFKSTTVEWMSSHISDNWWRAPPSNLGPSAGWTPSSAGGSAKISQPSPA